MDGQAARRGPGMAADGAERRSRKAAVCRCCAWMVATISTRNARKLMRKRKRHRHIPQQRHDAERGLRRYEQSQRERA